MSVHTRYLMRSEWKIYDINYSFDSVLFIFEIRPRLDATTNIYFLPTFNFLPLFYSENIFFFPFGYTFFFSKKQLFFDISLLLFLLLLSQQD